MFMNDIHVYGITNYPKIHVGFASSTFTRNAQKIITLM